MSEVTIVAAVAANGVIGRDGGLPWHLPEDLHHFRDLTLGAPVVMGRRTWDSLPDRFRPLPGRRNIVVTRMPTWSAPGGERAASLAAALVLAGDAPAVFVVGGASLYAEALPVADRLVLTELGIAPDGDTRFPAWDRSAFEEVERDDRVSAAGTPFAFVTYRRRR